MSRNKAREDVKRKIGLEQRLSPVIKGLFSELVKDFFNRQVGKPSRLADIQERLQQELGAHYKNVVNEFLGTINDDMPDQLKLSADDLGKLKTYLVNRYTERAAEQARIINETTATNEQEALAMANQDAEEQRARGEEIGAGSLYAMAAAMLSKKLRGRVSTIASFETQVPAEETKRAEVSYLLGRTSDPLSQVAAESPIFKTWFTQGDEDVRQWHFEADGQTVPENEPFIVGGQKLMMPGDTDLGATIDNVANCRCGAFYDRESVINERSRLINIEIVVEA